jgi:hypothetical protein
MIPAGWGWDRASAADEAINRRQRQHQRYRLDGDVRTVDDTRPPPPLHLL